MEEQLLFLMEKNVLSLVKIWILKTVQVQSNEAKARDTQFKISRECLEERGRVFGLRVLIRGYNAVGAFAGFDVIHPKILMVNESGAFNPVAIFRKDTGKEQRQVSDMTMNLPLFFNRRLLALGFGLIEKFHHVFDRFSLMIFDTGELIDMDKFEKQV